MGAIWNWVMEPILFVTVGQSLDFAQLAGGTIPRAVAIVCAGVTVRMAVTFVAMAGMHYTRREMVFYCIAWTPKATVQAALSGGAASDFCHCFSSPYLALSSDPRLLWTHARMSLAAPLQPHRCS